MGMPILKLFSVQCRSEDMNKCTGFWIWVLTREEETLKYGMKPGAAAHTCYSALWEVEAE